MNRQRLNLLANNLRNLATTSKVPYFNLSVWFNADYHEVDEWEPITDTNGVLTKTIPDCGTVACAVGHACLMPEFNKMGLKFDEDYSPVYREHEQWEAVKAFFDIDEFQSNNLFRSHHYDEDVITPLMVAEKINDLT